jgi:general secretion pathway protein K
MMRVEQLKRMERLKRLERFQSFKPFKLFKNQRGVALVIVLWIFIFLFVVAFEFSASVREEGTAVNRYSQEAEGYYLAIAGFEQELFRIVREPAPEEEGQPEKPGARLAQMADGTWREESFGGGAYRVRVMDEGGKINLNRADEETLRRVLTNLGVDGPQRDAVVDAILDWRDPDDLHRLNGAESDYYLSLSPPYTAKNGPFDTVEDLLWVRGVTPELFYGGGDQEQGRFYPVGLREVFTVDSPMDRVNLRTTSAEVIHALVGLSLEKSRAFIKERGELSEKTLADLLQLLGIGSEDGTLRQFVFVNPSVVAIEVAGRPAESVMERRVKGIVRVVGGNRGFELVRWVDRDIKIGYWTEG